MISMPQPRASVSIVTGTEGCLPRATRGAGGGISATPTGSECCCPRSLRLLAGPLLCCAAQAVFCLHGLGSLSLCLFAPCHRCAGFPCDHCPFSTSWRWPPPLPSPVNVYIVFHSVSTCLRQAGSVPPRGQAPLPSAHSAMQTGHLVQDFSLWS
ncbi:hypothetical protein HJG60_011917 [Phyllostomus discolor]|uniref:Uncharacterized protein n=1 Tax=Phyllostomus discolor TaxID=89673 RepID=A0A833ZD71_9CHIR|nr:hypothetical protein HJG60_011917 [Phyllostomus discolor]